MAARVKHEATVSETRFVFYRNTWSGPCDTVYNNRTFDFCRQQLHECLHTVEQTLRSFSFYNDSIGSYVECVTLVIYVQ